MRRERPAWADVWPQLGPVAAVLDEAGSHHDMGINDILVDDGPELYTGLKE